jgi:conjugal transfer pilus assembly protein TraB
MTPDQVKRKQVWLAGGVAVLVLALAGGLLVSLVEQGPRLESLGGPAKETSITSAGRRVNPQEIWVERMESAAKLTQRRLDGLEKRIQEGMKGSPDTTQSLQQLQGELEALKASLGQTQGSAQGPVAEQGEDPSLAPNPPSSGDPFHQGFEQPPGDASQGNALGNTPGNFPPGREEGGVASGFRKIVLSLKSQPGQEKRLKKTLETTIPAGAYARAILLGGVDASTAVGAPSDPRPILLRVTDAGTLPRRLKSDLKACHVLASAYGDLASERVYMRLETLTCTEPLTGEIVETRVSGYIAGEDGKAGVRGVVVDRSGEAVRSGFIAGFIGGMGEFLGTQQQRSSYPISPFGVSQALSSKEMLGASASKGVSNAMEKLADFYIKRAEQLQPVLQVAAGRQVDLIFTQGADIGSSSVKQTLQKVRDQARQAALLKFEAETVNATPNSEGLVSGLAPGLAPGGDPE